MCYMQFHTDSRTAAGTECSEINFSSFSIYMFIFMMRESDLEYFLPKTLTLRNVSGTY